MYKRQKKLISSSQFEEGLLTNFYSFFAHDVEPTFIEKVANKKLNDVVLTPSHRRILILTRIGMTTQEISVYLSVNPGTITAYKSRLKSILGIPAKVNFDSYVQAV